MCLFHHEKFNGSGYPHQLAGSNIPFVARIGAICDVYDALTTVRPYKRAWTQAEAIDTMMNSPGHFDPNLLKIFISRMVIYGTIPEGCLLREGRSLELYDLGTDH